MGLYLKLLEEYAQKQATETCAESPEDVRGKGAYRAYRAMPVEKNTKPPLLSNTSLKSKNINSLASVSSQSCAENHSAAGAKEGAPCAVSAVRVPESLSLDPVEGHQNKALNPGYVQAAANASAEHRRTNAALRETQRRRLESLLNPPDIQELVAAFGTYSAITTEAWADYDLKVEEWKKRIRSGEAHEIRRQLESL
jgi:hypothetical protein